MAVIGELIVNIKAHTASFVNDLERVRKLSFGTMREVERSVKIIGGVAAAGIGALATASAVAVARAAEHADKIDELSQRAGIGVVPFQELAYAAQFVNVETDSLARTMGLLAKKVTDAAEGNKEAQRVFQQLGISVRDSSGRLRGLQDILGDVADRFAGAENTTGKAGLAMELLSRRGAALIPLLNQGSAGLKKWAEEAHRIGIILNEEDITALATFHDNTQRLHSVLTGLGNLLAARLAPVLLNLSEKLISTAQGAEILRSGVWALAESFKFLISLGFLVGATLKTVGGFLGGWIEAIQRLIDLDLRGAWEALNKSGNDIIQTWLKTNTALLGIWQGTASQLDPHSRRIRKNLDEAIAEPAKKAKNNLEQIRQAIRGVIIELIEFNATPMEKFIGNLERLGASAEQVASGRAWFAVLQGWKDAAAQVEKMSKALDEASEDMDSFARQTTESLKTPTERLAELTKKVNEAGLRGKISAETWARAIEKINKDFQDLSGVQVKIKDESKNWQDAMTSAAHAIGTAFEDAILAGKGLGTILKGLLDDIIRIILRITITKPLEKFLGGFLGGLFGGFFQHGGEPPVGRPSIVGERGPELFIPRAAGTILPTAQIGRTTIIQIDARGADPGTEIRLRRLFEEFERRTVMKAVLQVAEGRLRS